MFESIYVFLKLLVLFMLGPRPKFTCLKKVPTRKSETLLKAYNTNVFIIYQAWGSLPLIDAGIIYISWLGPRISIILDILFSCVDHQFRKVTSQQNWLCKLSRLTFCFHEFRKWKAQNKQIVRIESCFIVEVICVVNVEGNHLLTISYRSVL